MQRSTHRLALLLALLAGCAAGPCVADTLPPEAPVLVPQDLVEATVATPADVPAISTTTNSATSKPARYSPATRPLLRGRASWYAHRFHGRRTASGERYDRRALTAAHPTLPLSSYVRVRNRSNGREVVVRINDRGPFNRGHVIDMSHAAAAQLGILRGAREVDIEPLANVTQRGSARRQNANSSPQAPHLILATSAGPAS